MTGTTPEGTASEQAASQWVRGMFGRIAPRYDLLNHLLSFNLDKRWRARTVARVAEILDRPDAQALDLCCGTGDVLLALERRANRPLLASDFCHPMLVEARRKISTLGLRTPVFEADALALPLAGDSLDLITVAFGFRNLANYQSGLQEMLPFARYTVSSPRAYCPGSEESYRDRAKRIRTCPNPSVSFPARNSSLKICAGPGFRAWNSSA
jgi:demethylmenaquinone methyltransferase/2-methoxy-6-polyprenyl-1,4-benzoquinol methylase